MSADGLTLSPQRAAERFLASIAKPARLLVAISGGSDSAGLLLSLVQANASDSDVSIDAVTIDHALRPESADEAVSVAAFCRRLGVRHFIRRWHEEKPRTGISAASREARYRLLMDIADEIDATAILTGHTLDDQAETVAMRAARDEGEGNLGLAGMADTVLLDRRRWLLRPFLHCRRAGRPGISAGRRQHEPCDGLYRRPAAGADHRRPGDIRSAPRGPLCGA